MSQAFDGNSIENTLKEYAKLLETDAQVKYALNAIRRYKNSDSIDVDDDRKSRHKRNIIAVDDNLKINYEMVKTTPGTFIETSVAASKNKALKEKAGKVSKMKTNYYKKRLYNMNEQFLSEQGTLDVATSNNELVSSENAGPPTSPQDEPPIQQQIEWLTEIHRDLLQQYRTLLQEEKKWFLKKEVMLDANTKLDLFTTHDDDNNTFHLGSKDASSLCAFP